MIAEEVFKRYLKVRNSGVTNMFDLKTVCLLAEISREEALDIMKNFSSYYEKFIEHKPNL